MREGCLARAELGAETWYGHVWGPQATLWEGFSEVWICEGLSQSTSIPPDLACWSGQEWLRALPISLTTSAPMGVLAQLLVTPVALMSRGENQGASQLSAPASPDRPGLTSGGAGQSIKAEVQAQGLPGGAPWGSAAWTAELCPQRAGPQGWVLPDPKSPAPLLTAVLFWTVTVTQTDGVSVPPPLWVARNGASEPVMALQPQPVSSASGHPRTPSSALPGNV